MQSPEALIFILWDPQQCDHTNEQPVSLHLKLVIQTEYLGVSAYMCLSENACQARQKGVQTIFTGST